MAGKLTGNGLWEGSRMMLPEHVAEINRYNHELNRRDRIELEEQEIEQISRALQQSMQYKVQLSIQMYDPFERVQVIGVVENISKCYGQYKVNGDWFNIDEIEGVEVDEEPC